MKQPKPKQWNCRILACEATIRELAAKPLSSYRRIASVIKISVKTVIAFMRHKNITLDDPCGTSTRAVNCVKPSVPVDADTLRQLCSKPTMTLTIMSRTLGVHHNSVAAQLRKLGLHLPTSEAIAVRALVELGPI